MRESPLPSIRDYLLGSLPDSECERLEEDMIANEDVFAAVEAAEDDLLSEYLDGRMSEADRAALSRRVALDKDLRQKLELAGGFSRLIKEQRGIAAKPQLKVVGSPSKARWPLQAAAAVAIVAAIASTWYAVRAGQQRDVALAQNREIARQIESNRIDNARPAAPPQFRDEPPPKSRDPQPGSTVMPAFVVLPLMRDEAAGVRYIDRPPGSQAVELQFGIGTDATHSSFAVVLRSEGKDVLSKRGVRARVAGEHRVVPVTLPASAPAGRYQVTLYGARADGEQTALEDYEFVVR